MTAIVDAIYEAGALRLLKALPLPEHTRVRIQLETIPATHDAERAAWLKQSERSLSQVWENDADDVYNDLLAP